MKNETLIAGFEDIRAAEDGVGALMDHGVPEERLTLLCFKPDEDGEHLRVEPQEMPQVTATSPADTAHGAKIGAAAGSGVGAVAALAALTIPGFGLVIGGGAAATALAAAAGTGVAGAISGGLVGYLVDQGVPGDVAQRIDDGFKTHSALVLVEIGNSGPTFGEARALLNKYGAGVLSDRKVASKN